MNMLNEKTLSFENALVSAVKLPGVKIDRNKFLYRELSKYCENAVVESAVQTTPQNAGISINIIRKIAKSSINYETIKVTSISAAAGIPGGFAMAGTIPADLIQYFGHLLRVIQKVVYLYGWESLLDNENEIDDETKTILTVLLGAMFGAQSATAILNQIVPKMAANVEKKLLATALTKTTIYPIVKGIAKAIGIKMTKEVFAKGVSKTVPVVGAVTSGGLTLVMFKSSTSKFRKYIESLSQTN